MAKEELIGIFNNENFEQLFESAIPISVSIIDNSQVMSHPLEDGSKVSDHQIFELIKISMPIILSSVGYTSVYQSIDKAYKSNTLFTIQTKVAVYKNMVIESKPRTETVDGGIRLVLNFTEFLVQKTAVRISPKYPADSDTQKRGVQSGSPAQRETVLRSFLS